MKRSVRDLMKQISFNEVPKIQKDATIEESLIAMERYKSDALLVMEGVISIGVFSEKDLAKISLFRKNSKILELKVNEAMSSKVVAVSPEYRLDECMAVMSTMGVRHLPVIENDEPIALLSIRHIMEGLIQDREFIIGELVKYVNGGVVIEEPKNNLGPLKNDYYANGNGYHAIN